jgi:hypothetical protein
MSARSLASELVRGLVEAPSGGLNALGCGHFFQLSLSQGTFIEQYNNSRDYGQQLTASVIGLCVNKYGDALFFLGASKRLYERLRPSVGWLVRWSVGWSVCPILLTSKLLRPRRARSWFGSPLFF